MHASRDGFKDTLDLWGIRDHVVCRTWDNRIDNPPLTNEWNVNSIRKYLNGDADRFSDQALPEAE